jgi:hypothetical protein
MDRSIKDTHSRAAQESAVDGVARAHGHGHVVGFEVGRSGDVQQTLLQIGIVLLTRGVELLNVELLQHVLDDLVTLHHHFQEFVTLNITALRKFPATGYTISHFQQFLRDFGDCVVFAVLNLPKWGNKYLSARRLDCSASSS